MTNTSPHTFATNYVRRSKNTLIGTFDLILPSGLSLLGATHHQRDGKFWVGMPAAGYVTSNGEIKWRKVIAFADPETSQRFMTAALNAAKEARGHD